MLLYDKRWLKLFAVFVLLDVCVFNGAGADAARRSTSNLTACQHQRRALTRLQRKAKAFAYTEDATLKDRNRFRAPRCNQKGEFEPIQCMNEKNGENCWCVDEYGVEIPGTHNATKSSVRCVEPEHCSASACRMYCAAGFDRDPETGCSVCRCRDPCNGITCPGQMCQAQEVTCRGEPCPPIPTCKKARSLGNFCPAGLPLAIEDSVRPFLCGLDASKPQCPPLYQCIVESGNDYGVCCPSAVQFKKPGVCPAPDKVERTESTGIICGMPCNNDLECANMEKCCFTKGCQFSCQQPHNVTTCHQARALADVLSINEREGRGYVPDCNGPGGMFAPKQCSRNGLVCWCVDPRTGHKIQNSMGAANMVNCDGWENMISRSLARSFSMEACDTNICAAVCEYGFKNDHNGCPTCECAEPCEGFRCPMGSHCEVASDPLCESGSSLCASWPICKPDLVYSNPCDVGTPLSDNQTSEVLYCFEQEHQSRAFQRLSFFDAEPELQQARSMTNRIMCPDGYKCTKLHGETENVCCPAPPPKTEQTSERSSRQQTMCEYLRDFSERMEGTEEGMQLGIPAPSCTADGNYRERQCSKKRIRVTRAEKRIILEENTIRRMRMLLDSSDKERKSTKRNKRDVERLKLYRVDDSALKVEILGAPIMGRSARVIDVGTGRERQQGLGNLFETEVRKASPASQASDFELVEMEVEECWCVDSFGTAIPRSRGLNVTDESCRKLRDEIDCLDLTCRMGCEYGFALDPDTRCPACQCRDPCENVDCGEGKECRIVDVSCEEEYCPPVPACLPRKEGSCPFLVPPGPDSADANSCAYECRTDSHCEGAKRCCSNGCGTQCIMPLMKTACQHLQTIQMHQSSELGIPAMKMNITQCDSKTGQWQQVQCSTNGVCWCVDPTTGSIIPGTRMHGNKPDCKANSAYSCPEMPSKCNLTCDAGLKVDQNGCEICECRNFCDEINCSTDEQCQLISVECVNKPCPKMPICVPARESVCPEGSPFKQGDLEVSCGPQNENEVCPTTHVCQLNPVTHRGVCCSKTRDVCFESMDNTCLAKTTSINNSTRYRFNPKVNKCVPMTIDMDANSCQSKNIFQSESACMSVCPALTQCERLKLKNTLAAQRSGFTSVWFQPRCDPITGAWQPLQCLGKYPNQAATLVTEARGFDPILSAPKSESHSSAASSAPQGVCWCADKKGAPLKGSLTRDIAPTCNSRQGRGRKTSDESDPLMEELIRQMTLLNDIENDSAFAEDDPLDSLVAESSKLNAKIPTTAFPITAADSTVTERVLELANSILDSQFHIESLTKPMHIKKTRCQAFKDTASFPVSCDKNGAFSPTQCNEKSMCWCVDAAGNQVDASKLFKRNSRRCDFLPVDSVAIELHLLNQTAMNFRNVYDKIKADLHHMLGDAVENLRVQENFDGTATVRFELHSDDKVDMAFAIESAVIEGEFKLVGGHFKPDITRSHFIHRNASPPVAQAVMSPESTIQLVLFIIATSSAFLVSILVVYIMLKRGKRSKVISNTNYSYPVYPPVKTLGGGDKAVDFSAPIFVLSASTTDEHHSIKSDH